MFIDIHRTADPGSISNVPAATSCFITQNHPLFCLERKAAGGSDTTKGEIRFGSVSCVFKGTLHLTVSCEKGADQSGRGFGT